MSKRDLDIETDHHIVDWEPIIASNPALWLDAKQKALNGPKVLMADMVSGLTALTTIESLLAVALTLRGAQVHTLLCDSVLPACIRVGKSDFPNLQAFISYQFNNDILCRDCSGIGQYFFEPLHLLGHKLGNLINLHDRERAKNISTSLPLSEIKEYRMDGMGIGEHAYAGTLRYFASGNLNNEPEGEMMVRRFFEGALLVAWAMKKLIAKFSYDVSVCSHGIYSPYGIVGEACRAGGVRVANWNVAYRKNCFIFSHGDTYHHTLLSEPTCEWENASWNVNMEEEIMEYLRSRWTGSRDWIWFHEKPTADIDVLVKETGIDISKPIIGMLTNVMWDAQLHYPANAFPDMLTWAIKTIRYFEKRPDLQLLIRIHPAEIRGGMPSRQLLLHELKSVFSKFPKNVFVVPPESQISTYAAMLKCDSVIIYGTKTGVELTSLGIPVIVAGEAWIRNKGLTIDVSSVDEYFKKLDQLPLKKKLDDNIVRRARKYAYHFFFRRMVPFKCVVPAAGWPPYKISVSKLEQLLPGNDVGLDIACKGIMSGSPFIYPAEKIGIFE